MVYMANWVIRQLFNKETVKLTKMLVTVRSPLLYRTMFTKSMVCSHQKQLLSTRSKYMTALVTGSFWQYGADGHQILRPCSMQQISTVPNRFQGYKLVGLQMHYCNCMRKMSTNNSQEESSSKQPLMMAIYGSFAIGAVLISALLFKEFKKQKLKWKGIYEFSVPCLRKLRMYRYKGYVLPEFAVTNLDDIANFEGRPDDIWVVSFPRSGTTWIQEIIYLIQTCDFEKAQSVTLDDRFPYFEFMYPGPKVIEKTDGPRFIKTHLPWALIPDSVKKHSPKFIYIARNPKDVVVSYFYFSKLLFPVSGFDGSFKEFFDLFVENKVLYAPWCQHVLDFWDLRQEDNVLYVTYEDLKKDTPGTIDRIATFLGKDLTADQKTRIMGHCSFKRMKGNDMTNHNWFISLGVSDSNRGDFMRKGSIGDWNNHFNMDMNVKMNEMLAKNFLGSDIDFCYEGIHFSPSAGSEGNRSDFE